jgi:hypothetical protein
MVATGDPCPGAACGARARLVLELAGTGPVPDEAIDALPGLTLRLARLFRDRPTRSPLRVELTRSEPFRRLFRAPIAFGAPGTNLLEFAAAIPLTVAASGVASARCRRQPRREWFAISASST